MTIRTAQEMKEAAAKVVEGYSHVSTIDDIAAAIRAIEIAPFVAHEPYTTPLVDSGTPSDVTQSPRHTPNREAIARAIREADENFGYSFNMTRLVDGIATHTLIMPGFYPIDFEDRDDGYRLIEERRSQVRADAIIAMIEGGGAHG